MCFALGAARTCSLLWTWRDDANDPSSPCVALGHAVYQGHGRLIAGRVRFALVRDSLHL